MFEYLMSLRRYTRSSIILLLTKTDLFTSKLRHSPITKYFPDYLGAPEDGEATKNFIVAKFLELLHDKDRKSHVLYTNATEVENPHPILPKILSIALNHPLGSQMKRANAGLRRPVELKGSKETT